MLRRRKRQREASIKGFFKSGMKEQQTIPRILQFVKPYRSRMVVAMVPLQKNDSAICIGRNTCSLKEKLLVWVIPEPTAHGSL